GIYEEFVFRVILITILAKILKLIFQWNNSAQKAGAVIIAAVLFSLFHFLGDFGDPPDLGLFIIRFSAGIFLGVIYIFRGFGIAAYTHSIYDLLIMVQITTLSSRGF
ncbi:MAG: CPBP family intramembrane glutamic endopeptidase, partial [Candidatus Neomarinimicrobiota bacterium]